MRAIQQARMRVEKNSKTKLRSHFNTLAGFCTTSFQEQLSFSALAQESIGNLQFPRDSASIFPAMIGLPWELDGIASILMLYE